MNYFIATIYGIIQGITEFAPVSSSGHLAILPRFMQIEDPGVFFDLMMHLGTALAVIVYFRNDIKTYCKCLLPALFSKKSTGQNINFVRNFVLATMASVIVILLIKDFAKSFGRDPLFIAFNLSFFGLLLWLSDRFENKTDSEEVMKTKLQWKHSFLIGASQALAIFPGVSRSGITISAARCMGLNREQASSFSFLLSLPIIFAGILYKIPEYMQAGQGESSFLLLWGVFTSFVFGLLTIHFFLKMIKKMGFGSFFIYRLILSAILFSFL